MLSLKNRMWAASILNAVALASELMTLYRNNSAKELSLTMVSIFLFMQITYMEQGVRTRSFSLAIGMFLSAAISVIMFIFGWTHGAHW